MDDGRSWGRPDKDYFEVPINSANIIAEAYNKDQVIIICWDKEHCRTHVTTYGKTFTDSQQAAIGGNLFKAALHWPDKLCHDEPYRLKKVKEALKRFKAVINSLDCECTEDYFCTIHSDLVLADQAIMALLDT